MYRGRRDFFARRLRQVQLLSGPQLGIKLCLLTKKRKRNKQDLFFCRGKSYGKKKKTLLVKENLSECEGVARFVVNEVDSWVRVPSGGHNIVIA